MKMFDPHIHMTARTTDDYQAMSAQGIVAVLEPAFWPGQTRRHAGSVEDYFLMLLGWERFRASQFGIRHFCALGLNPKEANTPHLAEGVLAFLPRYLAKDGVLAVGEIGYDEQTPAEDLALATQLELAAAMGLPALVHTPHRDKLRGTRRMLDLIREVGLAGQQVLIDHNNEETLPIVLDSGCWAGHSIYPDTKMDEIRMVALVRQYGAERIIVNSAADWGVSDPLKVPKTAAAMAEAGIAATTVSRIVWDNPIAFFGQSGRLDASDLAQPATIDQRHLYQGNSVLRGQSPRIDALDVV
jgi:predicted metal-dependent TIM-barrel fold hydrolase